MDELLNKITAKLENLSKGESFCDLELLDQLNAKMKTLAEDKSLSEIADHLDLKGEERIIFMQSIVASQKAWKEVKNGVPCECSEMATFLGTKTTTNIKGKGFDIFHFKCSCGKTIDRTWRAPSLDGKPLPDYTTTYIKDDT